MIKKALDIKNTISLLILVAVNFIFYVKYLERVTEYYLLISILFSFLFTSVLVYLPRLLKTYSLPVKSINISFIFILIAAGLYVAYKIPAETINPDRWKIITLFWNTFAKGDYVYSAALESGNQPGAMPFYFLLSYPFYISGSFIFMPVIALILCFLIFRYAGIKINENTACFLFLLLSPSFLWEIPARSGLYLNSVLVFFPSCTS